MTARVQRANCTPETRAKARRLSVLFGDQICVVVQGDHDRYEVIYDGLTCDCPAAMYGQHCSHVECAILHRAKGNGASGVRFCASLEDAEKLARMERGHGHTTVIHAEHGWFWVDLYTLRPEPLTLPRRYADLTPAEIDALCAELF